MHLPINTSPRRTLITADPSKLTYFARANAVRAGVANTWGALEGFNEAMPNSPTASSDTVKAAGAMQTVGDLFGNLGRSLLGATPPAPTIQPVREESSPGTYIAVGLAGAAVAGFIVWKVLKRA